MEHKEPKALQPNSTHRRGQVKHSPEGRRRRLLFNPLVAQLLNPFPILAPESPALRALLLLIIWWIFNWFFAHSMAANNKSYNILWPHLHLHSVDMKCATFTLPIHGKISYMYVCVWGKKCAPLHTFSCFVIFKQKPSDVAAPMYCCNI